MAIKNCNLKMAHLYNASLNISRSLSFKWYEVDVKKVLWSAFKVKTISWLIYWIISWKLIGSNFGNQVIVQVFKFTDSNVSIC